MEPGGDPEATQDLADPLAGKVIADRYRLEARIGQGGMGVVYRATHVLLDRQVALKLVSGRIDDVTAKRFEREAKSASRLDHENCVRVLDFGVDTVGLYLVMELLDGRELKRELAAGALPATRVAEIGRQVARALAHAHEAGLVHRDLKPDNVFLARRGDGEVAKILDFGLARAVEAGATLTDAGIVFGTPEYMSPEQISGGRVDTPSDVYALGVLLYHMATGMLPFHAADFAGMLAAHLDAAPVPPERRRPDLPIPPALSAVILRCLAKDPAARPTAKEVEDELGRPMPARRPPPPVADEPPTQELVAPVAARPRSRMWIALAAVPLVVAGVVAAVAAMRTTPPTTDEAPAPTPSPAAAPAPPPAPAAASPPAPEPAAPAAPASPAAEDLRQAARFRREGNTIKELYHLSQAVRADPKNAVALYQLGAALIQTGEIARGCETLARAGTYKPAASLRNEACAPAH
jgi:serine/threonine-protein kinase